MDSRSRSWLAMLIVAVSVVVMASAPTYGDAEKTAHVSATAPVNINTASVEELMTLEGIGRKVAEKVVEYRGTHGEFRKPADIRRVQGIGAGLWEKNRERIIVK
jgi:competence protein ComEA